MGYSSSTMTAALLLLAGAASFVESFSIIQFSLASVSVRHTVPLTKRMATTPDNSSDGDYDFDSILGEGSSYQNAASVLRNAAALSSSSPVIRVPDGSPAATVTLASSIASSSTDIYGDDFGLEDLEGAGILASGEEEAVTADPLLNNEILKRQHAKKLKREQTKASGGMMRYVKNPLLLVKGKDFADVTITILIPAFVSYLALKKVSEIAFGKLGEKADALYEKAAKDITYHVGDYESMEATYKDYKKKLWFNGAPSYINAQLIKRIAVAYCNQVVISPKSVSSLAFLMTMMKITDDEAADIFVTACRENPRSMSIAAKVLFYSEHVFKEKSAKKKTAPLIKQLSTMFGGMEPVMEQQKEMAESAYRDAVAEAGKGQTKMTEGWKILGLDKEVAKRIFDETKALGYLSPDELWKKEEQDAAMEKFAAEERQRKELRETIDKDGNLIDPNATVDPDKLITDEDLNKNRDHVDDDKDELGGSSTGPAMAKECGNCGYTLFIAKGREAKFFPSGFTCPQCGGARDQFKDVDMDV